MMDIADALQISQDHFPQGPEAVAAAMGVAVRFGSLSGCDGWCIRCGGLANIRINANSPQPRQRFTLAHEIAHLLQGTDPDLRVVVSETLASSDQEEKAANQLAAEMLLPREVIEDAVSSVPLHATALRRLARRAKVSEWMAACRVATLAKELHLINAAVLGFVGDDHCWTWSKSLTLPSQVIPKLLQLARDKAPYIGRMKVNDGSILTATLLGSPDFPAVFVQVLPAHVGHQQSAGERVRQLADWLFEGDRSFQNQVNGCLSAFKDSASNMRVEDAMDAFNRRYLPRWTGHAGQRIRDPRGQEYLRLRLSDWCLP